MSTRARREEYSTSNVVRVLHPTTRPLSPNNIPTNIDNNLDYLLDDLQSSVMQSKEMQYLAPSNTTTIIRERSTSPGGGEHRKVYKTSKYEYSSSSNNGNELPRAAADVQQKINSLDTLLQDLKHEREHSMDREKNYSNIGIDSGLLEPNVSSKSTRTYHTTTNSSTIGGGGSVGAGITKHHNVNRELLYDVQKPTLDGSNTVTKTTTVRQSRSRQRSPTYERNIETKVTRDVSYDSDAPVDSTLSRSFNYASKNHYESQQHQQQQQQIEPYHPNNGNTQIVELDTKTLPEELSGLPLSGAIMPGPGTKVTTTIKTFTYEIPGDTAIPTNQQFTYKNEAYNTNTSTNTIYPERDVPTQPPGHHSSTHIYKTNTLNTTHHNNAVELIPPVYRRSVSPLPPSSNEPTNINKTIIYKHETTKNTSNVYPPPQNDYPQHHAPPPSQSQPPNTTTYVYNKNDSTTNIQNTHSSQPLYPYDPTAATLPAAPHPVGPHPSPKQTYLYKRETTNTKNTVYGPPGGPYTSGPPLPPQNYAPVGGNNYPPQNNGPSSTVVYNYSTVNRTNVTNRLPPSDDHMQPLLPSQPFPTDGLDLPDGGAPPKRLDDLLASFDDTNRRGPPENYRDEPYYPRKEINTALATGKAEPMAVAEAKVPTKNVAGPPVYYPPGQEMFSKSEQSAAAWRAQGGYAKASGKYEYEAESKSKSSSKSGATMVPVCLPLCCAMPCSIM